MKEKLKSELKETSYSKINVTPLLSVVGLVVVIGFFLALPESEEEPKTPPPRAMNQGQVRHSTWSDYSGPVIPVGVWSDWNTVSPGCRVDFGFDKQIHRVQFRYYSNKILEYQEGTSPNMNSFRIMLLVEGRIEAPFHVLCR